METLGRQKKQHDSFHSDYYICCLRYYEGWGKKIFNVKENIRGRKILERVITLITKVK